MIMGIPIFDVLLAILRRLGRRLLNKQLGENKKSKVFGPDLDHLHHRLLQAGFSQKKVAHIIWDRNHCECISSWQYIYR